MERQLSGKISLGHAILALIVGGLFGGTMLLMMPGPYAALAGIAVAALTFASFRHFERMDRAAPHTGPAAAGEASGSSGEGG